MVWGGLSIVSTCVFDSFDGSCCKVTYGVVV